MLDLTKLGHIRHRGGKVEARCPACAEQGADRTGNHLIIADDGKYGCILFPGDSGADHRKRIFALAGASTPPAKPIPARLTPLKPKTKPTPRIPTLRPLNAAELAQIARLRGWTTFAGLQLLTDRGLLWHGEVHDAGQFWPSWIITDSARRNAQARRLDGKPWRGIGGAKAKTLPGCDASWPIGCPEIDQHHLVLLCEGQPDFAAALMVAWWEDVVIAPVCMTGAGQRIPAEALPYFAGKHVRIATHADPDGQGQAAGERWAAQLYAAGAMKVDRFSFADLAMQDGRPVKDLADYATLLDADASAPPPVLGSAQPASP